MDIVPFKENAPAVKRGTALIDRDNRTFICSVVYCDIANYSTKSVEVQIRLKEQFNRFTTEAIQNVAVNDRIILDTGDGAAICFLGDPEDALFVAMSLRDAVQDAAGRFTDDSLRVRFGINLGPVKVVNDINNRENIIGDGINVGQRVMSFAEPGQILVSRSYYEVVSRLTQEYARLFHYLGTRADKHVRQHEIYAVIRPSEQENAASATESFRMETNNPDRKQFSIKKNHAALQNSAPALKQHADSNAWDASLVSLKHRRRSQTRKLALGAITLAICLAVILSFAIYRNSENREPRPLNTALSPEAPLENAGIPVPENTQSPENIHPMQTDSAVPAPPAPNVSPQQDRTDNTEESSPENKKLAEAASKETTEPPAIPDPPDAGITLPKENPDPSPTERAQPKETAGPEQTPRKQPSAPNADIVFAISPWGEVFVDGKSHGASPPLTHLSIAPGKHVIEVINTAFPPFSQTIELDSNEQLKFSHKFK